ncbi:MAG: HAMP domain-containing protein [Deltaproteobacteria bacterium]|nr:HAMP domain-containing protein [Deltaproteobacteria bacterium]
MKFRSLGIRSYLIFSYMALVLLFTVWMGAVSDYSTDLLLSRSIETAETALGDAAAANVQLSEKTLTSVGEYIVQDKAEDVARELAHYLKGKKTYDYAQIRRNPSLRKVAIQQIFASGKAAGYTDLYDQHGFILFHPDPQVEGRNQLDWQEEYPETTELVKRSFTENSVSGYFKFFDKNRRERQKYSARVRIPGTPFIVAAIVNIDEFFLPTLEKIKSASAEISARTKERLKEHEKAIDLQVKFGTMIAGLALCLTGALGGLYFAAAISRPLRRLDQAVKQVGEGDFAVEVPEKGVREVVDLARSFNNLGAQLTDYIEKRDFIRDTFGRYVTQEVVKRLLESKDALEMGGETREVSILISDLRGFTALTSDMEPDDIITFLNRYLGKMIEILLDYHAVIDEILGDGILAFFGAPEPLEDHPVRAVACAMAMQAAMDEINFLNEADGLPILEMGLAVNTGAVVVGNIGSERRTKYSVVGAHVNLASRIESFALGGQVLISEGTHKRVKDVVEVGEVIQAEMKGIPGKTSLYEVRSTGGPYNIQLKTRRETLVELPQPVKVRLHRIQEKVVVGTNEAVWVTHLSETAARVAFEGELVEWEDVRLQMLDGQGAAIPGKIYGKVTQVQPGEHGGLTATIRFTSVAPEVYPIIRRALNSAASV